ncbi:MAG TPA: elongation factor G, partial [Candidatus Limnocylindrales bacterium]|nr:elongation factor G [Candidatus Limnocylindrales bacterium]
MTTVDMSRLRNVVLAGHSDSGKTTLAEHLLHAAGAINRLGKVDEGTASLDFEPEEQKRKQSLALAVSTMDYGGHEITLIDTPGYADFAAEVVQGFEAADAALLTMDASGGVEAGTERAVGLGRAHGTAALFVITRCERENADPSAALDALRAAFGNKIAPLQLAIGKADAFKGYVDLVHRKAYVWEKGKRAEVDIPAELADEVARRRDQLLEAAAEADDDVLTKYLEGEEVTDAELDACLHRGVRDSILAPVLVSAAAREIGIDGVLDAITRYFPSPDEEKPLKAIDGAGVEVEVAQDATGPLLARVFKTTADPFVGRLTYFRVFSGKIASHDHVWNADRGEEERIGQVLRGKGKDTEPVGVISAGEIGAVAKLVATHTGDALSSREKPFKLPPIDFPDASLPVAIEPQTKADLDKMGAALTRLLEEDPGVRVERQTETGEQLLWAQGESHIAVIVERLKRKFGAAVVTRPPRIPYRETIRSKTQAEGRHKKQTGGRGQFGHVWLEIEPNPDAGVEFATKVVGGSVPRQFWAGIEKGVRDVAEKGPVAGYPVIDFKATLYDGSFHTVDSDELSFRLAG